MIKANTEELLKSLNDFRVGNKNKMQGMVSIFVYKATEYAIGNTPLGDDLTYANLYAKRETDSNWQSYGLYPFEGFARGSWRVALDGKREMQYIYGSNSGAYALQEVQGSMKAYKLGDKVYISNYGPYIKDLEQNSSKQTNGEGIMAPTIDSVLRIASMSLKTFYENS